MMSWYGFQQQLNSNDSIQPRTAHRRCFCPGKIFQTQYIPLVDLDLSMSCFFVVIQLNSASKFVVSMTTATRNLSLENNKG